MYDESTRRMHDNTLKSCSNYSIFVLTGQIENAMPLQMRTVHDSSIRAGADCAHLEHCVLLPGGITRATHHLYRKIRQLRRQQARSLSER